MKYRSGMRAILLSAVALLATVRAEEAPCTAHDGDDYYDLSPLKSKCVDAARTTFMEEIDTRQLSSKDYEFKSPDGKDFVLNVCKPVNHDVWAPKVDNPENVAGFTRHDRGDFSIGETNTTLTVQNGYPMLVMTNGSPCPGAESTRGSTAIRFICDTSVFEAAILTTAFMLYIIVGTFYKRYVLELRGFDQIPRLSIISFSGTMTWVRDRIDHIRDRSSGGGRSGGSGYRGLGGEDEPMMHGPPGYLDEQDEDEAHDLEAQTGSEGARPAALCHFTMASGDPGEIHCDEPERLRDRRVSEHRDAWVSMRTLCVPWARACWGGPRGSRCGGGVIFAPVMEHDKDGAMTVLCPGHRGRRRHNYLYALFGGGLFGGSRGSWQGRGDNRLPWLQRRRGGGNRGRLYDEDMGGIHSAENLANTRKEATRRQRIEAEQRRRDELRDGYARLKDVLPVSNQKSSKVSLLERACNHITALEKSNRQMQARLAQVESEVGRLRSLNEKISLGVGNTPSPGQVNMDSRPLSPPPEETKVPAQQQQHQLTSVAGQEPLREDSDSPAASEADF
ncbi:predicted protein [Postia placenta Mad-698-R]|nr:predicted protein [Postia placenta Mad-698-R]